MSKFPLYDSLSKDIKNKDLTSLQKKSFIQKISKIDKTGHELIYALIRMYQVENDDKNINFTLPYNATFVENDIHFDLEKFPNILKQILFKFLGIHINKMNEEKSIENRNIKR